MDLPHQAPTSTKVAPWKVRPARSGRLEERFAFVVGHEPVGRAGMLEEKVVADGFPAATRRRRRCGVHSPCTGGHGARSLVLIETQGSDELAPVS